MEKASVEGQQEITSHPFWQASKSRTCLLIRSAACGFHIASVRALGSFRAMLLSGRLIAFAITLALALFPGYSARAAANYLTPEEQAAGWKLLFDGKNVLGLRGVQKPDFLSAGWKVEDGTLVLPKTIDQSGKVTGGDLVTVTQYADFEFSFEWRLAVSGASGILYGARAGLGPKPSGYEFQIIDDFHNPDGLKGGPVRRTGALYSLLPPGENKKINESGWNSGAIVVKGNHAEHWVNGEKVLEYDFGGPALLQAIRAGGVRGATGFGQKVAGPIVLLDKGEEIAFRSLRIRSLVPPTAPAAATPATVAPVRPGPTPFKSRIPIPGQPN
jgi:hypothetical protein